MSSPALITLINHPPDGARSFYSGSNHELDIQENRPQILLETYSWKPTPDQCQSGSLANLIFKANCEAKRNLYALGNIEIYEKKPLQLYHWQVIKATIRALYGDLLTGLKTTVFLFFAIPVTILFGWLIYQCIQRAFEVLYGSLPLTEKRNSYVAVAIGIYMCCAFYALTIAIPFHYTNLMPIIQKIKESCQDQFVAYQKLSLIPNSMAGFDVNQLANDRSEEGWIDPITLDTIPADQVTSNHMLRFGQYAIPIKVALKSMLTRVYKATDIPAGEIPHPIENRKLNPDEKAKFLCDISAFFAISDPQKIQACWNEQVSDPELATVMSYLINQNVGSRFLWGILPLIVKVEAFQDITQQILHIKRKRVLSNLLDWCSERCSYFEDKFFSQEIKFSFQDFLRRVDSIGEEALTLSLLIDELGQNNEMSLRYTESLSRPGYPSSSVPSFHSFSPSFNHSSVTPGITPSSVTSPSMPPRLSVAYVPTSNAGFSSPSLSGRAYASSVASNFHGMVPLGNYQESAWTPPSVSSVRPSSLSFTPGRVSGNFSLPRYHRTSTFENHMNSPRWLRLQFEETIKTMFEIRPSPDHLFATWQSMGLAPLAIQTNPQTTVFVDPLNLSGVFQKLSAQAQETRAGQEGRSSIGRAIAIVSSTENHAITKYVGIFLKNTLLTVQQLYPNPRQLTDKKSSSQAWETKAVPASPRSIDRASGTSVGANYNPHNDRMVQAVQNVALDPIWLVPMERLVKGINLTLQGATVTIQEIESAIKTARLTLETAGKTFF